MRRQIDNIKEKFPDAVIIEECFTGTTLERPNWKRLYRRVLAEREKENDVTIVFDELSRMSRNAEEGFSLYQELYDNGINLVFLKEPHLDTEVYRKSLQEQLSSTGNEIADIYIEATNHVLMIMARNQIELAFQTAQHEVDFLHKRTSEGVRKAMAAGKIVGRKKNSSVTVWKEPYIKEIIRKKSKDFEGTNNDLEVIAIINSMTVDHTEAHGKTEKRKLSVSRNTYYKYKKEI